MIMKKILLFVILCATSFSVNAESGVIVEAYCDSAMMMIGEQCGIHLSVTCDAGQIVSFPAFEDTIVSSLEIIPPVITDTQYVDNNKRMIVSRNYTVTAFDSALYYIPPVSVSVDSVLYHSRDGMSLLVLMMDVDTLNSDSFFGPKDIIRQPLNFQDVKVSVISLLLAVVTILLTIFLYTRWKDDKPIIRIVKVKPRKPAHELALEEIERIRIENISHGDDPKHYYTLLTDAVRTYLNDRFGFNATEMTSEEIIDNLMKVLDKKALSEELQDLFVTADLVKFAKMKPLLGENDRNLITALDFVKSTMPEEVVADDKLEEQIVEQKRSKISLAIILALVIISAASSVFLLYVFIREIYFLFF